MARLVNCILTRYSVWCAKYIITLIRHIARASWSLSLASWSITTMGGYWIDNGLRVRHQWRAPKRRGRQACGAKCRDGHACRAPAVWDKLTNQPRNGRCKLHGGKSTGPRTAEGKARIAEAQRERWRRWRESIPLNSQNTVFRDILL